jgi:diguanylate cyclase (GGDEF)-like protein
LQKSYRIRPYPPVIALILLFLMVMAFSLLLVSREANQAEAARTKGVVESALNAKIQQIIDTANENAIWDDAARVVYTDIGNQTFFWNAWGVASAEEKKFETIAVVDQAGRSLIQYRKGRALRTDLQQRFGSSFPAMINQSRTKNGPTGGIVSTVDGLMLIATAPILPTSVALDEFVPSKGTFFLVVAKPIDELALSAMARELKITDVAVSPKTSQRAGIEIRNPIGANVATLSWVSSNTGYKSLMRALPLIAIVALLHILFALILVRRAFASVKLLENRALIDSLSKLPNRRAIRSELDKRLVYGEKVALGLIDLDGFKAINDNFGHPVGDRLIVAVAEMLADLCGKSAIVARLGGDEFAILVNGYRCVERLESITQQILARMAHPFRVDERTVVVGASIGLASASLHDFSTAELMRRSDVAMYTAKRAGKMRMCWYDEILDQRQATARTIETELRASIETEAFEMVYQPVVSASSLTLIGVEALLRWVSPTRGDIGPSEFIPVAEETGLIDRIGMIALRKVCEDALLWDDIDVSINISVAQMRNPEFAKNLALVVTETGFASDRLILDISEDYILYDPAISSKTISEIRSTGVRIAIDNYGTGRMTLPYLRKFEIDKIKVDGSLIANACDSDDGLVILNSIATVAKALGIAVSAEGIETTPQAELVKVVGCEQLQGWLFSREVSAQDISALLAQTQTLPITTKKRVA